MSVLGKDLLRFNKTQKILCYDFESYSTNLCIRNLPWQCSWLTFDAYKVYDYCDYYIKWPQGAPSKEVQEITGYSQKRMSEEGRDPAEVFDLFQQYLLDPQYIILGHNLLGFDVFVHRQWAKELKRLHDFQYTKRIIDSLCIAKAYRFDKPIDKEKFLPWQWKMEGFYTKGRGMKCKLNELAKEFDIPVNHELLHHAEYDISLNKEVFEKLIWKVEI